MKEARNREDGFHYDVNHHGKAFSFLYCCHWTSCAYFGIKNLFWQFKQRRYITTRSPRQIFVTLPTQFGFPMFWALFPTLQLLSHRRNIATSSLLYRYFRGKCEEALHSLVQPVRHSQLDSHHVFIPFVWSRFHSDIFSWRPVTLLNRLPRECFPNSYDRSIFKSRVNSYLLYISP